MKKVLLFAAFAAMTATTYAQDTHEKHQKMDPHQRAEMQAKHMQKKLNLTEDQTRRVMDVNMQMMPTPPASNAAGDKKAMRAQRMELMQKREAAYSQILSPDQMVNFRKMKEERIEEMKDMRQKRMNEAPAPQR